MAATLRTTPLAEAAAVALGVTAAVALLAWPFPIAPNDVWVGPSGNDHASIAWTLSFVAERLAAGRLPWGHDDGMEFPGGSWLWPADLPEAALVAPITLALGPIAALNLLSVLHHGLAAGATWGWLRREGAAPAGAAAGALIVAFHGALVAGTYNGNPDVTPFWLVPAALWAALASSPLAAGGLAGLAGWANPYVGVMAVISVGARYAADRRWRELAVALLVAGALGALVIAGTTFALHAADAAIRKGPRGDLMGVASLTGLLRPWPAILRTDALWDGPRVATGAYLSLSGLVLAAFGRAGTPVPRWAWGLVAAGVIMALGPELKLADADPAALPGAAPPERGTGIPLPWALVSRLPGLGELHLTSRFTGLAAVGLAALASRTPFAWAPALVALDLLLVAGGARLLGSAPVWDDGSCEVIRALAPGPVLDLPPTFHELWLQQALCHGQPVAEGINRPLPLPARRALERGPTDAVKRLRDLGYRWIVVHGSLPEPVPADLAEALAPYETAREGTVVVYDIAGGTPAATEGAQMPKFSPPPIPAMK